MSAPKTAADRWLRAKTDRIAGRAKKRADVRHDASLPSLRPVCLIPEGGLAMDCPIGSAGETDRVGAMDCSPETWKRAFTAGFDAEDKAKRAGKSPDQANTLRLAAQAQVMTPEIQRLQRARDMKDRQLMSKNDKTDKTDCGCTSKTDAAELHRIADRSYHSMAPAAPQHLAAMSAAIERADGVDVSGKHPMYIASRFKFTYEARHPEAKRKDEAAKSGDPDPDDTAHRSARGANAAAGGAASIAKSGEMPDEPTTQAEWKRLAGKLGAYDGAIRARVYSMLMSTNGLVGEQVVAAFTRAWDLGDLNAPSDDEMERGGDAHSKMDDANDEDIAAARMRGRSASEAFVTTEKRGRSKSDVLAASSPNASKKRTR